MIDNNEEKQEKSEIAEEIETVELKEGITEEMKEKIIFSESEKKMKFYEELRKKFGGQSDEKFGKSFKLVDYLFLIPDFFILLIRLTADDRVSMKLKLTVGGIILYMMMPIDILPDIIPFIGYIDDLILIVYGLNQILNKLDKQIVLDNWSGNVELLKALQHITDLADKTINQKLIKNIRSWINKHVG